MNKFNIGDKVRIIKYGHLMYINRLDAVFMEVYKDKEDLSKDNSIIKAVDTNPDLIGREGTIIKISGFQGQDNYIYQYSIEGIGAWYNEDQLELNMNTKENKYYTPTIEEFHVGFEYEIQDWDGFSGEDGQCSSYSFSPRQFSKDYSLKDILLAIIEEQVRVKYLDKEDIENLGFKLNEFSDHIQTIYSKGFISIFIYNHNAIAITNTGLGRETNCGYCHHTLFEGIIKNKSELKVLLKQLSIIC